METYVYERPTALPAALAPISAVREVLTVDIPQRPQAHQVQLQVELGWVGGLVEAAGVVKAAGLVKTQVSVGSNGTTGFTGKDVPASKKRMDVRGVPPRGRPV